jgi:hypothetical protein
MTTIQDAYINALLADATYALDDKVYKAKWGRSPIKQSRYEIT